MSSLLLAHIDFGRPFTHRNKQVYLLLSIKRFYAHQVLIDCVTRMLRVSINIHGLIDTRKCERKCVDNKCKMFRNEFLNKCLGSTVNLNIKRNYQMHGINFSEIIIQSKESDRNVKWNVACVHRLSLRITFRRFHILDKFI